MQFLIAFAALAVLAVAPAHAAQANANAQQQQASNLTQEQKDACAVSCDDVSESDMCMRNRRPSGCTSCKHTASSARKGTLAGEAWGSTWTVKCP
jgi:hypothetical protein